MKKKNAFSAMLVIMLALGFVLSGCGGGDDESWSKITSANQSQLNGTWKGTYNRSMSLKELFGGDDGSFGNIDGIKANVEMDRTATVNTAAGTVTGTQIQNISFSGGRTSAIWSDLKLMMDGPGVTFNDSNHSVSFSGPFSETLSNFLENDPEINDDGTRIRLSMGEGFGYYYLKKQ